MDSACLKEVFYEKDQSKFKNVAACSYSACDIGSFILRCLADTFDNGCKIISYEKNAGNI